MATGIGEIDLTLPAQNLELFLAKPNRSIIAKLTEAFNKKMILKLGSINEITFSIPYEVDKNRRIIRNPNIDLIRERFLIKAVFAGKTEWYKVINIVNAMNEEDVMDVTCYLLPYELSDKNIRIFDESALNLDQVMNGGTIIDPDSGTTYHIDGLLEETLWKVGYVDADIVSKYRGYSFSSTTVLECVFKVAETLNALLVWDTTNKIINFYNADNYGINRGLTINYGRYLKSLSRESNSDEMVTRLKVFGENSLSIQGLNINGQNYLEDYSYFMYPFQRDASHNVIKKSHYMSDALCHAILDYTEYTETKRGQFSSLLTQKTTFQTSLATKDNALSALKEQMKVIENNIDIYKSMGYDDSALIKQRTAKQIEINIVNSEMAVINGQITGIDTQIATLKNSLKYNVFFTPALLDELVEYTVYKEFSNESYIDEQTLYDDAKKEFEKSKQPQVVLNMDIVNFMSIVEAQRDWSKLNLGDIITIKYNKMDISMQAKIIEITIDFESDNINFTIANAKDILTYDEKLIKMLYANNAASTMLDMKSSKWDGIDATTSKVNQIIENTWSAIKTGIEGGVNNTISITERGILVKNTEDPNNYLIIQNGVLAITNDNGNSWKHAITAHGIVGERIYGKLLAGANLVIDASDSTGVKTFTVDSSGVKILGSKLIITGGITEDNLSDAFLDRLDTDILEVQNAVDSLETNVNEILSDGMITSIEANTLKISLAQVQSESIDIINTATSLQIATEKTNYTNSLNSLITEINKWIDKTYPMVISAASRTEIKTRFSDIQTKKSILINAITAMRQVLSQTYTDGKITTVNATIAQLDSDIDLFSSDNVITLAESNSLKLNLNQVNSESIDLISVANTLGITTEKTNYSNALATVTTEVNKWIGKVYPLAITAANRTSVKTAFEALQSTKSILINKIAAVREQRAKDASVALGQPYNGVVIDAANGLVITKSDGAIRTILNATEGFSFEKKSGSTWEKKLYYNATTGNLMLDGELNARSIKIGGVEVIAGNKIDGDMVDSIKVEQLDATTAKIGTAMIVDLYVGRNVYMSPEATISWGQVTNKNLDYTAITGIKPVSNADNTNENLSSSLGINYTKIGATYVYTGTLKADQITAGKINANYIDVDSLRVDRIYRSNSAGSGYLTLSNSGAQSYGDLELWWSNTKWFSVYNVVGSAELRANDTGFLRSAGSNTYTYGTWDFTGTTIKGLTAVFG